jgi:hypothetical protein
MAFDFKKLKQKLAGQPDDQDEEDETQNGSKMETGFPKIVNNANINNDAYEAFKRKKLGYK